MYWYTKREEEKTRGIKKGNLMDDGDGEGCKYGGKTIVSKVTKLGALHARYRLTLGYTAMGEAIKCLSGHTTL